MLFWYETYSKREKHDLRFQQVVQAASSRRVFVSQEQSGSFGEAAEKTTKLSDKEKKLKREFVLIFS